jgi:hypothetical protein
MLWICIWRKQECVFEVELVNGVFQSIYTNPSEEAMMNSLEISRAKPSTISALVGKVLRLVIINV